VTNLIIRSHSFGTSLIGIGLLCGVIAILSLVVIAMPERQPACGAASHGRQRRVAAPGGGPAQLFHQVAKVSQASGPGSRPRPPSI
jgi:hypothetical protein